MEYRSIIEAARNMNLIPQSIGKVCRGENKRTGGYSFKYLN